MDTELILSVMVTEISNILGVSSDIVRTDRNLLDLGVDSRTGLRLISAYRDHGFILNFHDIFGGASIQSIVSKIVTYNENSLRNHDCIESGETKVNEDFKTKAFGGGSDCPSSVPTFEFDRLVAPDPNTSSLKSTYFPMTEMQTTLLTQSLCCPRVNVITYRENHSPGQVPVLKIAWKSVIEAEEIFKTRFELQSGLAHTVGASQASFSWSETVLSSRKLYEKELSKPFIGNIDTFSPVNCIEVFTLEIGNQLIESSVLWHVHHALIDGHSANLIILKVRQALREKICDRTTSFEPFARELMRIQEENQALAEEFWTQESRDFGSAVDTLNLPPVHRQNPVQDQQWGCVRHPVAQILDDASAFDTKVFPAAIYHAAWGLAIAKCADSDLVRFGTVVSGRNIPIQGVDQAIGPMLNTLPLNLEIREDETGGDFVSYVSSRLHTIATLSWSKPQHGFRRDFCSLINADLKNDSYVQNPFNPPDRPMSSTRLNVPLAITIQCDGLASFEFDNSLIQEDNIITLAELFARLVARLLSSPDLQLRRILDDIISDAMRHDLLILGNASSLASREANNTQDLNILFALAAHQFPNAIAVEKGHHKLTYSQLDSQSQHVAVLLSNVVNEGDVICVEADRSVEWIISLYSILKARAVYCPIDSSLPEVVKEDMIRTAGAKIFLTYRHATGISITDTYFQLLILEDLLEESVQEHKNNKIHSWLTEKQELHGAYLCFTSGSSGKPKGVICTHEALVAVQRSLDIRLGARVGWRIAQLLAPGFDACIHEIFSALSYGATLVLWSDGDPFSHLVSVDAAILTPSLAQALDPNHYPRLKSVILGGELVTQALCDTWAAVKSVCHVYGPTECTFAATYSYLFPHVPVTLGQPISSTRTYILDRLGRLVPRGIIGEICLAGIQVAKGYVGGTASAASNFSVDHILPELGERMYRTGDRGFWNPKGELCILGRIDRQIKLRGFRIDLSDVEARIRRVAPECSKVAVTKISDGIFGFIQPRSVDPDHVMRRISSVLPHYALPKGIYPRDNFPLTVHGKLDYDNLARSVALERRQTTMSRLSKLEFDIASVWKAVLRLDDDNTITAESDFLNLGGSSVTQIILYNKLSVALQRDVPLRYILENLKLSEIARRLDDTSATSGRRENSAEPMQNGLGVSAMEKYWWRAYKKGGCNATFTVPFACRLTPLIDIDRLENIWNDVLAVHTIFHRRYIVDCQQNLQKLEVEKAPKVIRMDNIDLQEELNHAFDLEKSNLIRILISDDLMLVEMSHIIGDLTSLRHLLSHVQSLYDTGVQSSPSSLSVCLPSRRGRSGQKAEFWRAYLHQAPVPQARKQINAKISGSYEGSSYVRKLPRATCERIKSLLVLHGATFYQSLLTAVFATLMKDEAQCDLVVGSPYFNRSSENEISAIGLFVEPLPIRMKAKRTLKHSDQSLLSLLRHVQDSSRAALEHAMSWEDLLHTLDHDADADMNVLFDVMVSFHDERHIAQFMAVRATPLCVWTPGAKFRIMIEFTAWTDDCILMRIEYDSSKISEDYVRDLSMTIPASVEQIEEGTTCGELVEKLQEDGAHTDSGVRLDGSAIFAKSLDDIRSFAT